MSIKRPLVWILVFTICGIYLRLGMSVWMCSAFCVLIIGFISRFVIKREYKTALMLLLSLCMGFFTAAMDIRDKHPDIEGLNVNNITAVVEDVGRTAKENLKMKISADNVYSGQKTALKLYVLCTEGESFKVGDEVILSGEILPLEGQSVPGGYNESLYIKTKGMEYKIFPDEIHKTGEKNGFFIRLQGLKERVFEIYDEALPQRESGVIKAMVTGDRDDIPEDIQELYTRAGMNHILCVSGTHVSIFALFVSIVVEKLFRRTRRFSAVVTIGFSLLFLAFTGFSASSVRAVTMIVIVLTGRLLYQRADVLNSLALAALVILCIQPLYLWNAGFQLSFVITFGIWAARENIGEGRGKIYEAFYYSLYASLFSFPLVAYYFYSISFAGIIVNMIVIPLCGILLFLALLTAIFAMTPLGAIFALGVYGILRLYESVCTAAAAIPFGYVLVGAPSLLTIALYYAALTALCLLGKGFFTRRALAAACGALLISVVIYPFVLKQNTVAFLSVGQGDSTVITTYDKRAYIIDGGGRYGVDPGNNTGATVIKPYLEYMGIDKIDGVFLTHFDDDHMLGILEICELMPIGGLYVSSYPFDEEEKILQLKETVEKNNIMLYTVRAGDKCSLSNNEELLCLSPPEGVKYTDGDGNHGSLVLKYSYGKTDILLMGDAAVEDERVMLKGAMPFSAEILKVGHHGSGGSTGEELLERVRPDIAVISCGKNNFYGHPHEEVLERLGKANIEIMRTDKQGSVIIEASDKKYTASATGGRETVYERIKKAMEKP